MGRLVWINSQCIEPTESAPIFEGGLLHGDGLFETMPLVHGVPHRLADHLDRLRTGAHRLGLTPVPTPETIGDRVRHLIDTNNDRDGVLRIVLVRGAASLPTLMIQTTPPRIRPDRLNRSGIRLAVSRAQINAESPLAGLKTLSYLENLTARREAEAGGYDEALILNSEECVGECSASNIFFVQGGGLLTPSLEAGILPGITRAIVLTLAEQAGLRVRQEIFLLPEILDATEAFVTNSLIGILPVDTLDGVGFGPACPGEITTKLTDAYQALVQADCGR